MLQIKRLQELLQTVLPRVLTDSARQANLLAHARWAEENMASMLQPSVPQTAVRRVVQDRTALLTMRREFAHDMAARQAEPSQ